MAIHLTNLWLFYVLAYAIALPVQSWANNERGEPFDDPEFLFGDRKIILIAMLWLLDGFVISLFVPVNFGTLFSVGLLFFAGGLVIVGLTFHSFAQKRGLVTAGIHHYSRNPGYIGWLSVLFGLTLMGWSESIWSLVFLAYFILTIPYFHWTVLLEERFLSGKYGDSYREYLQNTSRYFSMPKEEHTS